VLAYCCEQENGGRLAGAAWWKDRQWQQVCGVTAREVRNASRLIVIEGEDVVVLAYPAAKEAEVRRSRAQSRGAAECRWGKARAKGMAGDVPEAMPAGMGPGNAAAAQMALPDGNAEGKEKGKEREREREREAIPPEERTGAARLEKSVKGSRDEVIGFCISLGLSKDDAEWFFDKCEGCGWKNAGKPILDWKATVRAWKRICVFPSQKFHGKLPSNNNGTGRNIGHNAEVDYSQRPARPQTSPDWSA
jgi:hypothetical protein